MAPQQSYQGKRTLRRRRRRNNDCSRHGSHAPSGPVPEQVGAGCIPMVRPQRIWESRAGETTEHFMRLSTIILAIVSCALAIGLIAVHYNKSSQLDQMRAEFLRMSNQWDEARLKLDESGKLAEVLQTDLAARTETVTAFSNDLARVQAELGKVSLDLAGTRAEVGKGQARILQLEGERDDLAKRMEELTGSITKL